MIRPALLTRPALGLSVMLVVAGCTEVEPPPSAPVAAVAADAAPEPEPAFINLLPWGKVDFARGQFPSLEDCNAFVRALPTYSFYTTSERCEPLEDPVYCTRWQDDGGPMEIDCFKGVGGCEVELPRHDMRAETGARVIADRCEPQALAEAWVQYQETHPADDER